MPDALPPQKRNPRYHDLSDLGAERSLSSADSSLRTATGPRLLAAFVMLLALVVLLSPLTRQDRAGATSLPTTASKAAPTKATAAKATAKAASQTVSTSIMSYNIMTGEKTSIGDPLAYSEIKWSVRQPQLITWIRQGNPDIIGMQENEGIRGSKDLQSDRIGPLMPDYSWAQGNHNVPIMFKKDKYSLIDSGRVQISFKGRDSSSFNRYMSWAKLRHTDTGAVIVVFNAHTHPYQNAKAAKARSASYDRILATIEKVNPGHKLPFFVTGDFNARNDETSKVYKDHLTKMAAAGIIDSYTITDSNTTKVKNAASYNGYGINIGGKWRYRAIRTYNYHYDYVWVPKTGINISTWQVITGPGVHMVKVDGKEHPYFKDVAVPSDHSPVMVTVSFEGPAPAVSLNVAAAGSPVAGHFFQDIGSYKITGQLSTKQAGQKVELYSRTGTDPWVKWATVKTVSGGSYSFSEKVTTLGDRTFQATLGGLPGASGVKASSPVQLSVADSFIVLDKPAALTSKTTTSTLTGRVVPGRAGVDVRFDMYRSGAWHHMDTVKSVSTGEYKVVFAYGSGDGTSYKVRTTYHAENRDRNEVSNVEVATPRKAK